MPITIRLATPEDAAILAAFGERTFRDAFGAANRPEDLEAFLPEAYGEAQQRREIERTDGVTLLVEHDGELSAFAQIRRAPCQWGDVELARFYVDQAHHGRGIAQTLMAAVLDAARAFGGATLWLGVWERNPRAIAFYAKCEFRDVGSHPFLVGSDLQTDRIMVRFITS
jgi:GNAT superfamily N-acetyltransferase